VLLHGYPDNLQLWSRVARRLAPYHRVIAFDWPGMGESSVWSGGTTPQLQADRLLYLLDAWHIPRADLVGFDMGGQPALVAAARFPERIRLLTVMNSLVMGDEGTSWEIDLLRRYGWNRWLLQHLPEVVFRRAWETSLPRGSRLPNDLREDLWRCFSRPSVRTFVSRLCAGYQGSLPALPEFYRRIQSPTCLLWGGRDVHFPPAQGQRLHQLITGAYFLRIPSGEHWMHWHRPQLVAEGILRFTAAHA
jgi:pimeloyl-ACP methyl ester carboxylesterase